MRVEYMSGEFDSGIAVNQSQELFVEDPAAEFEALVEKLFIANDESLTRKELIALQRQQFDALSELDQKMAHRLMAYFSLHNDSRLLKLLQLSGHECDSTLAVTIEKELSLELPGLHLANEIFSMTYLYWDLWYLVKEIDNYQDPRIPQLRKKLEEIQSIARKLAKKTIIATHSTREEYSFHLESTQFIEQSSSRNQYHYEGSGVYTGILGSFKDWGGGKTFEMKIQLGDTIPTIVDYRYPKAMANVLCEVLDIDDSHENQAMPHGLIQWEQIYATEDDTIPYWKVQLIEDLLNTTVVVVQDDIGDVLIANVHQAPIEWASIARALEIRRFVPLEEYSKIKDEIVSNTEESEEDDLDDEEDYENLPANISLNKKLRRRLSAR